MKFCISRKVVLVLSIVTIGSAFAPCAMAAVILQNGSFELATPVPAGNNFDTITPSSWTFSGSFAYPRVGSGAYGYPATPDGTTMYAVEGERSGILYQDLGTMVFGETYNFSATILRAATDNSYRASFIGNPSGTATELAFITEANFAPAASSSVIATFSYTPTFADAGMVIRLQLSDNGTTAATRSAFDAITVTTVPEPATTALLVIGLGSALGVRRRRVG